MSKQLWIEQNLKPGEQYAGLILGKNGAPDHHLILLPGQVADVSWKDAQKAAADAGGELPTRREQALLYANLKEEFEPRWYWSCEEHASGSGCAWYQYFDNGNQHYDGKNNTFRARFVRRLIIK